MNFCCASNTAVINIEIATTSNCSNFSSKKKFPEKITDFKGKN